jgi:hypothetical protein
VHDVRDDVLEEDSSNIAINYYVFACIFSVWEFQIRRCPSTTIIIIIIIIEIIMCSSVRGRRRRTFVRNCRVSFTYDLLWPCFVHVWHVRTGI